MKSVKLILIVLLASLLAACQAPSLSEINSEVTPKQAQQINQRRLALRQQLRVEPQAAMRTFQRELPGFRITSFIVEPNTKETKMQYVISGLKNKQNIMLIVSAQTGKILKKQSEEVLSSEKVDEMKGKVVTFQPTDTINKLSLLEMAKIAEKKANIDAIAYQWVLQDDDHTGNIQWEITVGNERRGATVIVDSETGKAYLPRA